MTIVEADQSGRIEMSGDTTVAVSNGFTCTVKLSAAVKQELRQALGRRGVKPNLISIRVFVGAILLGVRDHVSEISGLKVDAEYAGYEAIIRSLLVERIRSIGGDLKARDIWITSIGRRSPAHRAAIRVTRGQVRADRQPTLTELLEVC